MLPTDGFDRILSVSRSAISGQALPETSHLSDPRASDAPSWGHGSDADPERIPLAPLDGSTILLVEDEAIIAVDIEFALRDAGARVVGPAGTLPQALSLARNTFEIDGAILDINLAGESVFRLADHLVSRAVPMIFHTGCDLVAGLEGRFPDAGYLVKPVPVDELLWSLARRLG